MHEEFIWTFQQIFSLYWSEFQAKAGLDTSDRFFEAFHFDDNKHNANMLAELVLLGIKRATAGLLWSYEVENKMFPTPCDYSVVTYQLAE